MKKPFIDYVTEYFQSDEGKRMLAVLSGSTNKPLVENVLSRVFQSGMSSGQKFLLENDFVIKECVLPYGGKVYKNK